MCVCIFFLNPCQVVKKEGMKSDMSTLMALCEKADNDVRACLNSMQVSQLITMR